MSKKIRVNKKRRICRFAGCKHLLSIYNPETFCHVHQQYAIGRNALALPAYQH
jgi:hypothetical protein